MRRVLPKWLLVKELCYKHLVPLNIKHFLSKTNNNNQTVKLTLIFAPLDKRYSIISIWP